MGDCCNLTTWKSLRGAHRSHMRLMSSFSAPTLQLTHERGVSSKEREEARLARTGRFVGSFPLPCPSNSTVSKQLCLSQFPVADIPSSVRSLPSLPFLAPSPLSPPFSRSLPLIFQFRLPLPSPPFNSGLHFPVRFPSLPLTAAATVVRPTKRYVNFQSSLDGRRMRQRQRQ